MIAIVDYGVGNLFSLSASLAHIGAKSVISSDPQTLLLADRLILPGVGAFGDAMRKLSARGLTGVLRRYAALGKPLLGICLGMQLLFEESEEYGRHQGLGLLKGRVCPLQGEIRPGLKIPHIGWNALKILRKEEPLLKDVCEGDFVYYVHSYYAKGCEASLCAGSEYDVFVPGVVRSGNVFGTQFHPEKSGKVGLLMLRAFAGSEAEQ